MPIHSLASSSSVMFSHSPITHQYIPFGISHAGELERANRKNEGAERRQKEIS